jgi:hypothetical protein
MTVTPDELSAAIAAGPGDAVDQWVLATFAELTTGRTSFAAVHHPLGFLCLPVVRLGEIGVCVHLWNPRRYPVAVSTSPIHCHSWDLVSYVLYGTVRNDTLEVLPAADGGATHRVFEVRSGADGDEVRATDRVVRCARTTIRYARAGEAYTLTSGEFHSTTGSDTGTDDAATVVIGRTKPGAIDRSLGGLHTPTHRVRRTSADPATTTAALHAVARRLSRSA